jgi:hypothetical protein
VIRRVAGIALVTAMLAADGAAQSRTVAPICIACRNAAGLRLNYRDRDLDRVAGANVTVWFPYDPATGTVTGFAIGLPATGGREIAGIAIGPAGFSAGERFEGIGVAGLGAGVGGSARGLLVAGLGAGVAGDLTGIMVAGLGAGIGGNMTGIAIAGLGGGIAGRMRGITVAGLGVGGGASEGITIAGLGGGFARGTRGLTIAGLGVGAGESLSGITIAGLGAGTGGTLRGIAIGGLGLGAPNLDAFAVASIVKTESARAVVVAPAWFQAKRRGADASARGVFVSAFNDVRGAQRGVSIGVVNYARSLRGVQLGAVNIVNDGRGPKVLPIINWR